MIFTHIIVLQSEIVIMEKKSNKLKYQELMDKLMDLAHRLYTGRKSDPNSNNIRKQLEAIQIELQTLDNLPQQNNYHK